MKAIDFVVRTGMGAVQRGQVAADETVTRVSVSSGTEVSLNVRQIDLQSFARVGNNLEVVLVDGRVVLIENYFSGGDDAPRLFISADGYLNEVTLVQGQGDLLLAQYGPTEQWGKWSPSEDLIFVDESRVVSAETYSDDEVSMLGAGLLGGGGLGLLGGAAVLGGTAILGGGGGGGGEGPIIPTVNEKDPIIVGGKTDPKIVITGTGEPGSDVDVTIGDQTVSTEVDEDGNWKVEFEGDTFPEDGEHDVDVHVVSPDGDDYDLDGPSVTIDTTPPDLDFTDGTVSVNDITNAVDHQDGVELAGTGEAGASLVITVGGQSYETSVGQDGTWSIVIDATALPAGEYDAEVKVVATDGHENSATYTDTIRIDTEIAVALDSGLAGGDDMVNAAEQAQAIVLTGTADAGSAVSVEVAGQTLPATVDADGNWSVTLAPGTLQPGEYAAEIKVTATDAAGNSETVTGSLDVDTLALVSISSTAVEVDGVINAAERADGVTLTGTTQPGSSVQVTFGSTTLAATVDASGNWSVDFPAGAIPQGETQATVTAVATDAAGNTASTQTTIDIDTLVRDLAIDGGLGGADGVVNAAEAAAGLTVTGQVEPGSTVVVQMGSASVTATVAADGSWTASFAAGQIPSGEYTATLTATATDAAGNVDSRSTSVRVDTDAGSLTLSQAPIEGDNVVNYEESLDGVIVRGTSDPGAIVEVTLGGVTLTTVTDDNGNWERLFTNAQLPAGDAMNVPIVARKTDAAGNMREVTGSVGFDRVVEDLTVAADKVGGEGTVNAAERAAGVTITGTVEPGSSVVVNLAGVARTATVAADGTWTVTYPAGMVPQGEDTLDLVVNATDRYGNTDSTSSTVQLDTLVNELSQTADPTGGDGTINIAEAAGGITLAGEVEAGSTVMVTVGGIAYEATVNAAGAWTLDLPPEAIPAGADTMNVTIEATDAAGNTDSISQAFALDLTAPHAPDIESYTRNVAGYSAISVALSDDDVAVFEVDHGVPGSQVGGDGIEIGALGIETFSFNPVIADGSHLIVHATDDAGNSSSTYLVLDETSTSVVDLSNPALGAFNIEHIDLQFAEDSQLTLTEADIVALSGNTDTVVVTGGSDDKLTITGASKTTDTVQIEGQTYDVYTMGDTARIVVDEDVQIVI